MLMNKDRPSPNPTYMSDDQKANYLANLRSARTARPSGSRPPPPSKFATSGLGRTDTLRTHNVIEDRPILHSSSSMPAIPVPQLSPHRADSSKSSRSPFAGRPIAKQPSTNFQSERPTGNRSRQSSMAYMEREARSMEKQEVKSIRRAMQDLDVEEDRRVHAAALDEAAELVWKHQNVARAEELKNAPFINPDNPNAGVDIPTLVHSGNHTPNKSPHPLAMAKSRSSFGSLRSSANSTELKHRVSLSGQRAVSPPADHVSIRKTRSPSGKSYGGLAQAVATDIARAQRRTSSGSQRIMSGEKKPFMNPHDRIWEDPQDEPTSPKKLVPEMRPVTSPMQSMHMRRNPFARVRAQHDDLVRSESAPVLPVAKHHAIEIQRNPPSQSRNPAYMVNNPLMSPPLAEEPTDDESPTSTKDGIEIRGDDIRAATGKSRKDRSPMLPQPTLVSDRPGRPIVSFQQRKELVLEEIPSKSMSPRSDAASPEPLKKTPTPPKSSSFNPEPMKMPPPPPLSTGSTSRPPIPILNLPDDADVPSIVLPEEPDFAAPMMQSAPATPAFEIAPLRIGNAPSINIAPPMMGGTQPRIQIGRHEQDPPRTARAPPPTPRTLPSARALPSTRGLPQARALPQASRMPPPSTRAPQRPLPTPSGRPLPRHAATAPLPKSTPHYTPSIRQSGALCAHCALPIAGRILSAAGQRFHPSCFVCHECHTNLELVAFYPEPDKKRDERLERIHARQAGLDIPIPETMTEAEYMRQEATDGDPTGRFYCHLDFHELFSPRCKSCKTPIEGEVIVACGAEWHAGHFFCAQCGDPFDSSTPFVEKDDYAWCVGCHTNRYSSKCRKCKKPVTDVVVKALGWEWHEACFSCVECDGDFHGGQYFLRGESQDPVCVKCEERRLKA